MIFYKLNIPKMKPFLVVLSFCFSVFLLSCSKNETTPVRTIRIGGLYSITGNWSTLGKASREAMNIALEDVNAYLESRGANFIFSTVNYDTRLDTADAKTAIQSGFTNNDIRIFIGPQSSAELGAVRNYADENKILVISQGSTASSLAIPGDAIFRYCPGDGPEGGAMSRSMYAAGKRVVITLARNDAGNIGLQKSVNAAFASLGGQVDSISPYATNLTNYSALLAQLKTKIQQYAASLGADKVAVYIASFDECADIFSQAAADPAFATVKWYGGDGVVQSAALLSNTAARDFAIATTFFAPNFGLPSQPHPDLAAVATAIRTRSGVEADAYALSVYDAMWVVALTIANYPDVLNDFSQFKTAFSDQSEQYFGITGPALLDVNGDRAIGSFDYWGIVNENGSFLWKVVGKSQ